MFWILVVLLGLIAAFAAILPADTFVTTFNAQTVAGDASTLLVLAAGATLVIVSGGLDLSIGSVMTFSAVASALAMKEAVGGSDRPGARPPRWSGWASASGAAPPGAPSTGG